MGFRDDTLQAIGDWIVASTGLAAANLQRANEPRSARTGKPLMTFRFATFDGVIGTDELIDFDDGGTQRYLVKGWRTGTAVLIGFGAASEEWLVELAASAKLPDTVSRFLAAGLGVREFGPIIESGPEIDGVVEQQFSRTLQIEYGIEVTPGIEVIVATNYTIDLEFIRFEGDPDPLLNTITGTIP